MGSRYADDLALAHLLADIADGISMARFRALDLHVRAKPDLTPVSDADTAVERALRATLSERRAGDGVLGEEYGLDAASESDARGGGASHRNGPEGLARRWVIDPIDGTKNYIRGVPIWATLIALMEENRPVVGLVSAPALGRRWWAAAGQGAFAGPDATAGTPIRVSGVRTLADASFCFSDLRGWEQTGRLSPMLDIMRQTWRNRAYGDFYGYMLLAEGAVDIMVEPELSLWDIAALVPIVTEAGGKFTDLDGKPAPASAVSGYVDSVPANTSSVASNGAVHRDILAGLAPTGGQQT